MQQNHPHALFAVAHTDIRIQPNNNHERTLRVVVNSNLPAGGVSVRFSNRMGDAPLPIGAASLALCDAEGTLQPDSIVPLTVGGRLAFELPAGGEVDSDVSAISLAPGDNLALSIYYPTSERVISGNWIGGAAFRSRPGNFTTDLRLPEKGLLSRIARTVMDSDLTVGVTTVGQVVAHCPGRHRVVACFGDSITQQGNWTTPLAKRLYHRYPGEISLCNLGISGNQLLGRPAPLHGNRYGLPGAQRFAWDVLDLPGLTHAIIEIGSNDLGLPGSQGLPADTLINLEQYAEAMRTLCEALHARGVKAYAATICPRAFDIAYDENREKLRGQFNDWIRSTRLFDAVLDFDAVVRRPEEPTVWKEGYVLPDGLHPSPYGGMRIAKSIDLSLFGG